MNTNKPKPPRKLLSETVVELKTDYPTAVERLQQLSGRSRETDHDNKGIYFECNRKGMFHIDAKAVTRAVGMRQKQVGRRIERIARTRLDIKQRLAVVVPHIGICRRNGTLLEVGRPARRRDRIAHLGTQRNGILHTRRDRQFIGSFERGSVLLGHHHLFLNILSLSDRRSQQKQRKYVKNPLHSLIRLFGFKVCDTLARLIDNAIIGG